MQSREEIAKRWLAKLTKLNAAHGKGSCSGKAPHKPLLLLCLLDMAESGELTSRSLVRTAGLVLRFKSYGTIVAERWPTRLDLSLPLFHLSTQGFWEPLTAEMQRATSSESCLVCDLNPEFYELLADASFRTKARIVLISKYFNEPEKIAFFESLGLKTAYGPASGASAGMIFQEAVESAKRKGRCARFAVRVVSEYRFTCALTGYCCMTSEGASIVDAAHIEPWPKRKTTISPTASPYPKTRIGCSTKASGPWTTTFASSSTRANSKNTAPKCVRHCKKLSLS